MAKRAKEHKKLVKVTKGMKASKKACQKFGMNYKENPYCFRSSWELCKRNISLFKVCKMNL